MCWDILYPYTDAAFIFMLRMSNTKPFMLRLNECFSHPWHEMHSIKWGEGCYLSYGCNKNPSKWVPIYLEFNHPRNDIQTWNKCKFPEDFIVKDYEIWQLIE